MSRTYKKKFSYISFDTGKTPSLENRMYKKITVKKLRGLKTAKLIDGCFFRKIGKHTGAKKYNDCSLVRKMIANPNKRNFLKNRTLAKKTKANLLIKAASLELKED
jgi:hypothetical protein